MGMAILFAMGVFAPQFLFASVEAGKAIATLSESCTSSPIPKSTRKDIPFEENEREADAEEVFGDEEERDREKDLDGFHLGRSPQWSQCHPADLHLLDCRPSAWRNAPAYQRHIVFCTFLI